MTVTIVEERLAGIPALVFYPAAKSAGMIVLFQRFSVTAALDANLGYILAKAGFTVICPEASGHGSRFNGNEALRRNRFWQILHRTLEELPQLVEAYLAREPLDRQRIGVFGTSMGGFAVAGAMVRYPWIRAGAAYMGGGFLAHAMRYVHPPLAADVSLCRHLLADYDAEYHVERLTGRPLFLWHGAQDDIVSCRESELLRDALRNKNGAQQLTCIIDPHAGHKITQSSITAGVEFISHHLRQE